MLQRIDDRNGNVTKERLSYFLERALAHLTFSIQAATASGGIVDHLRLHSTSDVILHGQHAINSRKVRINASD